MRVSVEGMESKQTKNKRDDPNYGEFESAMKHSEREHIIECVMRELVKQGVFGAHHPFVPNDS